MSPILSINHGSGMDSIAKSLRTWKGRTRNGSQKEGPSELRFEGGGLRSMGQQHLSLAPRFVLF